MKADFRLAASLIGALSLSACNSSHTPDLEIFPDGKENSAGGKSGPLVYDLLHNFNCEIFDITTKNGSHIPNAPVTDRQVILDQGVDSSRMDLFKIVDFVAFATLTLDVTNNEGVSTSFSYIDPLSAMFKNTFTLSVTPQYSEVQHRNITLNLNWDFENVATNLSLSDKTTDQAACHNLHPEDTTRLTGQVGLAEAMNLGLMANNQMNDVSVVPNTGNAAPFGSGGTASSNVSALAGVFGTQIDFTVAEGVGGGPNWTLARFKGPAGAGGASSGGNSSGGGSSSGGSTTSSSSSSSGGGGGGGSGPLSISRTAKDTLIISFSPACLHNDDQPYRHLPNWAKRLQCCEPTSATSDKPDYSPKPDGDALVCPRTPRVVLTARPTENGRPRILNYDESTHFRELDETARTNASKPNANAKDEALGAARSNNYTMQIQGLIPFPP